MESLVKNGKFFQNRNFCQKWKVLSKIESFAKIETFVKNGKFCQKSKVLSTKTKVLSKIQSFVKNPIFILIYLFGIRNICFVENLRLRKMFVKIAKIMIKIYKKNL